MSLIPNIFGRGRNDVVLDPFSLEAWDPLRDRAFHDFMGQSSASVDWRETPHVPGLNKDEVKVQIEDDRVLQFIRSFWLPQHAKVDQVKASMENGLLTVTVPKQGAKKPHLKTIHIPISSNVMSYAWQKYMYKEIICCCSLNSM